MTSVAPIDNDQDFSDSAAGAEDHVDAAAVDAQLAATKNKINALLTALALVIRDDDTLVDQVVRLRNLHPEILTAIAAADAWQPKLSVACASTADLTLSGEQTIDGVTTNASRVLVKDQTLARDNGIYVTGAGAWTRATDADVAGELGLACVLVTGGTTQVNTGWVQTVEADDIVLGTTSLVWAQYSGQPGIVPPTKGGTGQTSLAALPTFVRRRVRAVAVASTNIAAPGASIDGVALSAGDRVLLTAQATASQNGIWVWNGAAAAMTRPVDFPAGSTVHAFADVAVTVNEGTAYQSTTWRLTTLVAITIDTTNTAWQMDVLPSVAISNGAAVRTVATLADLTALAKPATAVVYEVRGFAAEGDGGGGVFRWDPAGTATADGGTILAADAGGNGRWLRRYGAHVEAEWFGAKGDGSTDDYEAINAALALNMPVRLWRRTYKIATGLLIDAKSQSLESDGAILDCSAIAGVAVTLFSTAVYTGGERVLHNHSKAALRGLSLKGATSSGTVGIQIGRVGSSYENSNDLLVESVGVYQFEKQLVFVDNAWRTLFRHCGFETGGYPIYFDTPGNAGEVLAFDHCWFVDWTIGGPSMTGGQWLFTGCSFFGGATTSWTFTGDAHVDLVGCNIEAQPSTGFYMFDQTGGAASRLRIVGGQIIINPGTTWTKPLFKLHATASLVLEGVVLPTRGSWITPDAGAASGYAVRALVEGPGRVTARGCLPNDSFTSASGIQLVLGGSNALRNGGAELGNTNGWTAAPYGTGGSTHASSNTAAHVKNGARGHLLTAVANGGIDVYQEVPLSAGDAGRTYCWGLWYKAIAGAGTIGFPSIEFRDAGGNVIGTAESLSISSTDTVFTWGGVVSTVPDGAVAARIHLDAQQLAGGCTIAYDDVWFQLI